MSVRELHYRRGDVECGASMSEGDLLDKLMNLAVAGMTLMFGYTALLENGISHSIVGFLFGFALLFFINGQRLDRFYIHIGEKIKIGGDAYDRREEQITIDDPDNEQR